VAKRRRNSRGLQRLAKAGEGQRGLLSHPAQAQGPRGMFEIPAQPASLSGGLDPFAFAKDRVYRFRRSPRATDWKDELAIELPRERGG